MFDPLRFVNEIIVVVAVSIALMFIWRYQSRVLVALTGDDRIHGTVLDLVWWAVFQCCGTCNGEWTRCLTRSVCCDRKWRGMNLVKALGQRFGLSSYTVELRSIVVGDLPCDGRGTFSLCVECAANPPMMSSLAEEALPKVVHFPEVIVLRLRWSPLESQVHISVKELNFLGSTELCHTYINAMSILEWSEKDSERFKRFEMKPSDPSVERETPAWILVEFSQPSDLRDLDHFHGDAYTVRTTKNGHSGYEDKAVTDFKHEHPLLDNTGHVIEEPLEQDMQSLARLTRCNYNCCRMSICCLIMLGLVTWAIYAYIWSCYRQFKWLTMAFMKGHHFPISRSDLQTLVEWCHFQVDGTGLPHGIPCRPNVTEVLDVCTRPAQGGHFPSEQPYPVAFGDVVQDLTGVWTGVPCDSAVCQWNLPLEEFQPLVVFAFALALLVTLVQYALCNRWIRNQKAKKQRNAAKQAQDLREQLRSRNGSP